MNISMMIGNLAKEPEEIKGCEKSLCKLILAVNENYTDKDGNRPCNFYNLTLWGKMAENAIKYLAKGSKVAVIGKFQNRKYEKDGEVKYITEFVVNEIEYLHTKNDNNNSEAPKNDDSLPF